MFRRMLVNMLRGVLLEAIGLWLEQLEPLDRKTAAINLIADLRKYLEVRRKYRWLSSLIPY